MKVSIDKDKCIGCGACAAMCPEVFEVKDGKSHVLDSSCKGCDCKAVADACPTEAVIIK